MQIDINQVYDKSKIIDVRTSFEFNNYNIPESVNIPAMNLLKNPEEYMNKQYTYYLICSKGHTSLSISKILNALGYNCYSISGGIEKLY